MRPEQEPKRINSNNFEPFVVPEEKQVDRLFVNLYCGHYAQNMEFNRRVVEKTLKLAHLDGQVFLTSLPVSRDRPFDANSDGSVSGKRSVFFGQKPDEEKNNPYCKISSIPRGWKIEINNQRIMEELMEKKIDQKKSRKVFIGNFNSLVISGLENCILKEKFSSIKDEYFRFRLFQSLLITTAELTCSSVLLDPACWKIIAGLGGIILANGYTNIYNKMREEQSKALGENLNDFAKMNGVGKINPIPGFRARKFDHPWEYVFPMVEIDKAIASVGHLNVFGQNLVREKRGKI